MFDLLCTYVCCNVLSGLSKLKGRVGELDGKGENGEEGRMQELEDAIAQVSSTESILAINCLINL